MTVRKITIKAARRVVSGRKCQTFRPDEVVTRAQAQNPKCDPVSVDRMARRLAKSGFFVKVKRGIYMLRDDDESSTGS